MTSAEASSIDRRRLRSLLRRERENASLTQEQVAESMEWSLSKVIRMEAGSVSVSANDARALLRLYNVVDPAQVDQIVGLARSSRQRPWWSTPAYRDRLPGGFLEYVGLEASASRLDYFNAAVLPGLVQTPAYGRALMLMTAFDDISASDLDVQLEIRQRRQQMLLDPANPPDISVILDEAALRHTAGGAEVMRDQLRHLETVAALDHVSIRVLAFAGGAHGGNFGPFIILHFDEGDDPALYIENLMQAQVVRDQPDIIAQHQGLFRRLSTAALSEAQSLALIRSVAGELR